MTVVVLLVGALIGFLSGLFGVGGSSIATPLLRVAGVPRLIALATPLPVTLPAALAGTLFYWRRGLVRWPIATWTALGGIPGVVAGAELTSRLPGRLLMVLTGLLVTGAAFRVLRPPAQAGPPPSLDRTPVLRLLLLGAAVGFLSGLLANGGGLLLVPAYLLFFRLSPQEAAASSLVVVFAQALPGTLVHWSLGHIDPTLAGWIGAASLPFTYLGGRLAVKLHRDRARRLFGLFLLLFGGWFFLRSLYRAEIYGWW